MAVTPEFSRKPDKDKKLLETHRSDGSITDRGELTYCIVICQKVVAEVVFMPKTLLFLKLLGASQNHSRVLLRVWINTYKAKQNSPIPLIWSRLAEAALYPRNTT